MTDDVEKFEDPQLKSAIRRVRGADGASPELVARVRAALATELVDGGAVRNADGKISSGGATPKDAAEMRTSPKIPVGGKGNSSVSPMRKYLTALAAILVLGIGGGKIYLYMREQASRTTIVYGHEDLMKAMLAVQDAGTAGKPDFAKLNAPLSDPSALAEEASAKLSRTIPNVDLSKQGWTLDAASLCTIQNAPAARFHYVGTGGNQGKTATLISMPAALLGDISAPNYDAMSGSNAISGYTAGGSLNCVVGDPTMSPQSVTDLRDAVKRG